MESVDAANRLTDRAALVDVLRDRRNVVATGLDRRLLDDVLEAVSAAPVATPWKLVVTPSLIARLSGEFVRGTTVADLLETDAVELYTVDDPRAERTRFVTDAAVIAVAGPKHDRALVTETDPGTVDSIREDTERTLAEATAVSLDLPGRMRLYDSAERRLSRRFRRDLHGALEALDDPEALAGNDPVDELTFLLAIAARTDHLFYDVRTWAEDVGIAPRQRFIDRRRDLVHRGLIETIKVPDGGGRPPLRLRAIDSRLDGCDPGDLLGVLRERYGPES